MAKQELGFVVPLNLAIALNAITPDPGGANAIGAVVWSTTTTSLLRWSGTAWVATEQYIPTKSIDGEIIPIEKQRIVYGNYEIIGTLELIGDLVIL